MLYFAYGSNMKHAWLRERCPDSRFIGPVLLTGYRLAFRYPSTSWPGGGAADILQDKKSEVHGGLFRVSAKDLLALDQYEDLDSGGYQRVELQVFSKKGKGYRAISYEVCQKLETDLPPRPGYAALVIEGAFDCQLPKHYINSLRLYIEELGYSSD